MANKRFTDLATLTSIANGDLFPIVDISDTTDSAEGTTKKITRANLGFAPSASPTFTGTVTLTGATLVNTGTLTLPTSTDTLVGKATTDTLTNKRITARILSATSYTTNTGVSLNIDNLDQFIVTAQAGALLINNPTGTATEGQRLIVAVTGTAARALTYDTQFESSTVTLPTTTVTTARLNMGFIWRSDTSKWVIVAIA